jgi:5-methylcytosine-specific restriction endonuclease McrA
MISTIEKPTTERKKQHHRETAPARYAARKAFIAAGDVTVAQLRELYATSRGCCHYCGSPVKARFKTDLRGFDHVVSQASGGRHTISNLVVCCRFCNSSKSKHRQIPVRTGADQSFTAEIVDLRAMTRAQLAAHYGKAISTIDGWLENGCPHSRSPRITFNLSHVEVWRS